MSAIYDEWAEHCLKWHGRLLTGKHAHWCHDWDGLPVDETTEEEASCHCYQSDTHWLAAKMTELTRTWPNYGSIPMSQPNPYARIDAHPQPTERELAVQRAVHIVSQI